MATKFTIDATNRLFIGSVAPVANVVTVNVQEEFYSEIKDDWQSTPALQKLRFPITPIGGNPFGAEIIGDSYVLGEGWQLRPYEADHTWILDGNLDTDNPNVQLVIPTISAYSVWIKSKVSTLVELRSTGTSGLTAGESTILTRIDDGTYGQKETIPSTDPATVPGYIVLYDNSPTPVLIGHKEIYQDRDPPTLGWVKGKDIMFEGPLVAGSPP